MHYFNFNQQVELMKKTSKCDILIPAHMNVGLGVGGVSELVKLMHETNSDRLTG